MVVENKNYRVDLEEVEHWMRSTVYPAGWASGKLHDEAELVQMKHELIGHFSSPEVRVNPEEIKLQLSALRDAAQSTDSKTRQLLDDFESIVDRAIRLGSSC